MKQKLIIHIGAPKCGSSALQSVLEILEKDGTLKNYKVSYPLEYSIGLGRGNAKFLFDDIMIRKNFDFSINFLSNIKEQKIILSLEMLFGIIIPNVNYLIQNLSNQYEVTFLVAIREASSWLFSDFSQHIKQNVSNNDFIDHILKREYVVEWDKFIKKLRSQNKNMNVLVTDYKDLFSCVEDILGLPKNLLWEAKEKNKDKLNLNFSLKSTELEVRRIANILNLSKEEILKLKQFFSYDIKNMHYSLLEYIKRKYSDQYEKVKKIDGVIFYEKND